MAEWIAGKAGRPPSLTADQQTLQVVRGLGQIQATSKECAAVLGVTEPTWIKFKKKKPVLAAFESGVGEGLASLRRRQFKLADAGNATMLIWLGKQYLGQADKQELTGRGGGPVETHSTTRIEVVPVPAGSFIPAPANDVAPGLLGNVVAAQAADDEDEENAA